MLRFFPSLREDNELEQPTKRFLEIKDPYVETDKWEPIGVKEGIPDSVRFIDGVRRTELRTSIFDGEHFAGEGIFLSVGAGVLEVDRSGARPEYRLLHREIKRYFVHNLRGKKDIPPLWRVETDGGPLEFESVVSPVGEISEYGNFLMKKLEVAALRRVDDGRTTTIFDGPVKVGKFFPNVVYSVKESKYFYLQGFEKLLLSLKGGQRSPIFRFEERIRSITDKGVVERTVSKIGCYVRIGSPSGGNRVDPLGGLVRLEVPAGGDREETLRLLERGAAIVHFFANSSLRDRRSPQNLTTIAYLERELRRRLGEYRIVRRFVGRLIGEHLGNSEIEEGYL